MGVVIIRDFPGCDMGGQTNSTSLSWMKIDLGVEVQWPGHRTVGVAWRIAEMPVEMAPEGKSRRNHLKHSMNASTRESPSKWANYGPDKQNEM